MTKFYLLLSRYLTVLLIFTAAVASAQSRTVSGKVTSADDGSGMPGVSIAEKGTSNGVISDANGNFSISVSPGATLVFSFVGMVSQEVPVGDQTALSVQMVSDVTQLGEVVVVGYGQIEKKDATGSLATVSTRDFNRGVITSPQDLIVGKIPGVAVTPGTGAPGSNPTIRIRSGASLNASNDPLIIIDGFPVDRAVLSGVANPLASINPNDIETYTVLKDASATAIYGVRASNGVIIITTKRGKEGKPTYNFSSTLSISTPIKYFDVLTAKEYRKMVNEQVDAGVINASALTLLGDANTDWQKEIFRTAVSSDNNLSASGSLKGIPFRASYGYTTQQGIVENTDLQRHSVNLSLTPSFLDDHLKVSVNVKASHVNNNFGEAGAVGSAISYDPTQPVRSGSDDFGGYTSWISKNAASGTSNPVAQVNLTDNTSKVNRIITNGEIEYKLHMFPDIKLHVNAGLDYSSSDGHNKVPLYAEFERVNNSGTISTVGRNNTYSADNKSELLDLYFSYNKTVGLHKIDFTGGYGWQHFLRERKFRNANGLGENVSIGDNPSENYLLSLFGRLNYSFNDRYLLTVTLRDDMSSRFSKDNRQGIFPAVGLAWRIKDEAFLANVNAVSDLKLRLGYGKTGQQDISNDYPALALYTKSDSAAYYQFGGGYVQTVRPEEYDANIHWETTASYNAGLDFGVLNNRITGSFDVYLKKTTDLLSNIKVPAGSNFSNFIDTNIGSMEAKGIEIGLQAIPIATDNLTWNFGFNFTYAKNEITNLLLVKDPNFTGLDRGNIGVAQNIQNHQVGYAPFSFFTYQQVYDDNGKPVEGLYVNRSGDPVPVVGNTLNRYRPAKPTFDYLMGINSRVTYKAWDFSFSGRISIGNYVYNNNIASRAFYNNVYQLGFLSNLPSAINDTNFVSQQQLSDYYVQNGSFFKMDNMSVGYTFKELLSSKVKARVSATVQNAFMITKYDGIDPEVDGGIDNNIYPRPRVFLIGVSIDF
ncbi:MAG: TonB-dependent receptor [Cyclobacteriaceae bacterium]